MESTITHLTPTFELCEEKAAKVLRWIAESEDLSKQTFAVSRAFEHGVLQDNTAAFLRLLLEESVGGKSDELELNPEELQQFLTDAFKNTYLYLLTPQSFIPEFLSFESDTVHISAKMLARLGSFANYPYFPEMLEEWFTITSQSSATEDPKITLKKFLNDVERSIIKYSTPTQIATYLTPLYEFHGSEVINRGTVEILFADKGLIFPADNEKKEFTVEEVSDFLKEAYLLSEVISPIEELPAIPQYDTFLQELREIGVVLPPPHSHIPSEEKKILPSLDMFIGSKLRKRCLEKIFHNNENEYIRAIAMLNATRDYSQAQLNLNTLLHMHKVEPDSKVAIRLTEALQLRFGRIVNL